MRTVRLVVWTLALTAAFVAVSFAAPDTPCTKNGKRTPVPLGALGGDDADALAQTLSSVFPQFVVTSEAEKSNNDSSDQSDESTPSGKSSKTGVAKHLCLADRANSKAPDECNSATPSPRCDLDAALKQLDRDAFRGVGLNSNFIMLSSELGPVDPKDFKSAVPHPTSNFDLMLGDTPRYLLLVPSPESMGQPASAGALAKQAAEIKHDLLALAYQMSLPDDGFDHATEEALRKCLYPCFEMETTPWVQAEQAAHVERWVDRHTVRLTALDPREVVIALTDYFASRERRLVLLSKQQAIMVLPAAARDTTPAILTAEALERDVLYRREQAEKTAQAAAAKAALIKTDSGSSPSTTANPTIKTTVTAGASKTPATTTVTTITSPQASAPSSAAGQGKGASGSASSVQNTSTSGGQAGGGGGQGGGQSASQSQASTPALKSWPNDQPFPMDRVQRLYHFRHAKAIADAINKASGNKDVDLVEAFGDNDDLLLILPPTSADGHDPYDDIHRAIAMIDLPRPQVSLQVWSYQISGKDESARRKLASNEVKQATLVQESYEEIRRRVLDSNERMRLALQDGFGAILDRVAKAGRENFFDEGFADYLTGRYQECIAKDHYCLGYYGALQAPESWAAGDRSIDGSLSRIFLFLAAASDSRARDAATAAIQSMQRNFDCSNNNLAKLPAIAPVPLCFPRFQKQLETLVQFRNLRVVRAALLDFFFQYKQLYAYSNDFIPYDLQRTAHELDNLLHPVVNAFSEDLDEFVTETFDARWCAKEANDAYQCHQSAQKQGSGQTARSGDTNDSLRNCDWSDKQLKSCQKQRATGLLTSGMVQVTALSGTAAQVSGKVDNYFDITPPMSLSDILNPNQDAAAALKNVLEPKEITLLTAMANMGSQPRIHAQVSENASLTITPTALDTASSAELKVEFDVGEPTGAPPGSVDSPTARADILNRVEDHHVTTDVRVESLKLFQLSSFTMDLTHPQRGAPLPLIGQAWEAIFGTTPGIDRLFHFPPTEHTVENRSIAIIRAVVVPTAMDIGESIPFETDRISDPATNSTDLMNSTQQIGGRTRPFHKALMSCIREGRTGCWSNSGVKLSALPDDQR